MRGTVSCLPGNALEFTRSLFLFDKQGDMVYMKEKVSELKTVVFLQADTNLTIHFKQCTTSTSVMIDEIKLLIK